MIFFSSLVTSLLFSFRASLSKALFRFYKDLLMLENYAIMTYCSFSKILKKHDKNTGFITRKAFMSNVVQNANFTEYKKVVKMLAETQRLCSVVDGKLKEEGKKTDAEKDERLFIDMILQLNQQASVMQAAEKRDMAGGGGGGGGKEEEKVKEMGGGMKEGLRKRGRL